jgi:ArsR family transcriptional regulator
LAKYFRGLTDVTRLCILDLLCREGELNVSELVERLGQSQGRVSSHLACLRECGYVSGRRDGKFVYYRVADQRVPLLLALARDMLAGHAEAIIACTRM